MPTMTTAAFLSQQQGQAEFGKRRPVDTRRTALKAVKRGMSVAHAAKLFKVHKVTVHRWRKQWETERDLAHKKIPGRPRKLTDAQVGAMKAHLAEEPTARNIDIIAATNVPITEPAVSKYLKREGYSRKKVSDEPVDWPNERVLDEIKTFLQDIATVPEDNRVYMDESFSYLNDMPHMGRAPKGQTVRRPREAHAVRYMFALAIRKEGLVHAPAISKKTMTDEVFMSYVRAHLVPNLRAGDVVIWDRLGKAGKL